MKRLNNIPLFIIIGVLLVLLVIGGFFDLQIAEKLYIGRDTGFGVFCCAIGISIPYICYSIFGGFMFADALYHKHFKKIKIFNLCALCFGVGMSICGLLVAAIEFTGNGAFESLSTAVAAILFTPICGGLFYLGFRQGKNNEIEFAWIVVILTIAIMLTTYGGVVNIVKYTMCRPRYRELVDGKLSIDLFHRFYEPFKEYNEYIAMGVSKEEFNSFPSGHACTSSLMIMMLPYLAIVYPKLESKKQLLFYIGVLYTVIICVSRMLVGAHFLSDICVGVLLTVVNFVIMNYIVEKKILKIE